MSTRLRVHIHIYAVYLVHYWYRIYVLKNVVPYTTEYFVHIFLCFLIYITGVIVFGIEFSIILKQYWYILFGDDVLRPWLWCGWAKKNTQQKSHGW